jgi:hypothetical protein
VRGGREDAGDFSAPSAFQGPGSADVGVSRSTHAAIPPENPDHLGDDFDRPNFRPISRPPARSAGTTQLNREWTRMDANKKDDPHHEDTLAPNGERRFRREPLLGCL